MFEYPAATPLDEAALAICAARSLNPPEKIHTTENPNPPTNREVAACAAAQIMTAYVAAITKDRAAIRALNAAIAAHDTTISSPTDALIDAMRASLPTAVMSTQISAAIAAATKYFGYTQIPIIPIDVPLAIAAIDAYLTGLANEPFFVEKLNMLIAACPELGQTPARAGLRGIKPIALSALFPSDAAEFYTDPLDGAGVNLDWLGGNCPVQAEGEVDSTRFYFRARGNHWELWIGDQAHVFEHHPSIWSYRQPYRTWPDAGWMREDVARHYIAQGVARWRDRKTATPP